MSSVVDKLLRTTAPTPLESTPSVPVELDMLWAAFFATGEPRPIWRLIEVAEMTSDSQPERLLLVGAARWSLTGNAVQHPRVLEILKAYRQKSSGERAAVVTEIISAAESRLASHR